jgi:hypothetical protein
MRALVLSCACVMACYSPELKRCTVLCVPGGSDACPDDMTCGADSYCHASGDTMTCRTASMFTLTVTPAGTGSGVVTAMPQINCPPTCTELVNAGSSVELMAIPNGDSRFAGWGGACTGANPTCVVVVTSAMNAGATFNLLRYLTVEISGSGSGDVYAIQPTNPMFDCKSTAAVCTQAYDQGTSVTLMAVPAGQSAFGGWGGDCTFSNTGTTCTVVLNAPITADATFE